MVVKKRIVKTETIIHEDKPKTHNSEKTKEPAPKTQKIVITEKKAKPTKRRKRKKSSAPKKSPSNIQVEKLLIENFVALQKVMTNMAGKFDSLSTQISKLLELFEISARNLAEKGYATGEEKKIVEKLDSLLEQNRTFAKGIAMLHEKEIPEPRVIIQQPRNFPPIQQPRPEAVKKIVKTEYHGPSTEFSENPGFSEEV